jgi:hypothetical protein
VAVTLRDVTDITRIDATDDITVSGGNSTGLTFGTLNATDDVVITQGNSAPTTGTSITADSVSVTAASNSAIDIGTINTTGDIALDGSAGGFGPTSITAGTLASTAGNVNLLAAGSNNISVTGSVTANTLNLTTGTGNTTLNNAGNDVTQYTLATSGGTHEYSDSDGFTATVGASGANVTLVAASSGTDVNNNNNVETGITFVGANRANGLTTTAKVGNIGQASLSTVAAGTLTAETVSNEATITLNNADATTATLTSNNGAIAYTDKDGVTVTAAGGTGNVTVIAGAEITADNAFAETSLDFAGASTGGIFSATANNLDLNVNTPATIIASNTVALITTGNDAELTIDSEVSGSNGVTLQTNGRRSHIRLNDDSNINSKGGTVIVKTLADRNADITQVSGGTIDSDGNTELSTIGDNSQVPF